MEEFKFSSDEEEYYQNKVTGFTNQKLNQKIKEIELILNSHSDKLKKIEENNLENLKIHQENIKKIYNKIMEIEDSIFDIYEKIPEKNKNLTEILEELWDDFKKVVKF